MNLTCKLLALLLAGASLTSCVSVEMSSGEDRHRSYVLSDARPRMASSDSPLPVSLIIQSLSGDPLANSLSIAWSEFPGELELYKLSHWSERPIQAIPRLFMKRLSTRGSFASVAALGEGVSGEYALGLAVESIYHDAGEIPGSVKLSVRADLIERQSRTLIARQVFESDTELSRSGPAYVAEAMGVATADIFDSLIPWLEAEITTDNRRITP